ncbi:putative FtsJ-like methyltransferase [Cafeteria roenbergensis virus]|uniref:Putative FtsJ-like methyltransferase n=1 Tax=Cafeteria roenbergensis virus (strain BV-PW1) TaxID=693272 RepID=E3T5L3_CROVB|nr:putative FtsJ-like methyltransferase [Cafeteria roenbergensis virus BV-PW1]ADO67476.1 putative FtsJ-like methyltransferase [Cafeteria roenbergensis virus BV-PW1]
MSVNNNLDFPITVKLPNGDYSQIKDKLNSKVRYSNIIAQPEFNLGFHSYIHQTKNKMSITSKLSTKEKFYYIVNPFESDEELLTATSSFLDIKDNKPEILSRAFFKMWEIMVVFKLADTKDFSYSALAEGPGSFLQAVLHYREKYFELKNNKFHSITINPEDGKNIDVSRNFLGYYEDKYPNLIKPHKTYKSSKASKYKARDTGDLTDFKSISNFRKEIKKTKTFSNLVTADGGFAWNDENYQEQEAYPLIIGQMLSGLMIQEKNGDMVIKMFETFTTVSIKLTYLLSTLYNEIYFYKPYFSRASNSERYLILKGFKYDQKKDKKILDVLFTDLEKILKQFDTDKYITNLFEGMTVPNSFIETIRQFNIMVANKQQKMINLIITYIKENNYFGDKYHQYLDNHKKAIKFWIENFLVDKNQLKGAHEKWSKYIKEINDNINNNNEQ